MIKDASLNVPPGKAASQVPHDFIADLDAYLAERDSLQGGEPGYALFD